jgi:hypothetical protein
MTFGVLSGADPAAVRGVLGGCQGSRSGPAAIRSNGSSRLPAGPVAPAGGSLVPYGEDPTAGASRSPPPDSSNRPVEAEPRMAAAAKTKSGDQVPDLPKAVGPLDVHRAPRSLGEGPFTDDALGAGGDLQVGVWCKQRLGLANVTVPIDAEAYDDRLRRHLVGLDLSAPRDLHPTAAHGSIRREELFFRQLVRARPVSVSLGDHDWGPKLAWCVALFCGGRDVNRCLGYVDADSAGRAELIAQSCEPGAGQFG